MNHFYDHSLSTADSSRTVFSYWQKDVHSVLVKPLGLNLSRKSVVQVN